jgi:hypothetical protein
VLGVSRSGFNDWARRAPSDRALSDAWLLAQIKEIHAANRGVSAKPGTAQPGPPKSAALEIRGLLTFPWVM